MRGVASWLLAALILGGLFATLPACDKGGGEGGEDDVAWPEQPANGCPVAFQFIQLTGQGDDRAAELRIFNFSDKVVRAVQMTLHYNNEAGEELDTFPWGATAPALVAANHQTTMEAGFAIPDATANVSVTVDQVTFDDGTTWQAPESE